MSEYIRDEIRPEQTIGSFAFDCGRGQACCVVPLSVCFISLCSEILLQCKDSTIILLRGLCDACDDAS